MASLLAVHKDVDAAAVAQAEHGKGWRASFWCSCAAKFKCIACLLLRLLVVRACAG